MRPVSKRPVGRGIPQPRAAAWNNPYEAKARKEAAEHDRALTGHTEFTLRAMSSDLGSRIAHDRRDSEQRWIMGRRAAVLRMLGGNRKGGQA